MSTDVSSVNKHFPSAENGFTTTLASTISSGATTVPLNSVAGYANGEVVVFIVDPSDTNKKQSFTGTVDTSGVQITGVMWTSGTNQTHTAGATVVDYVDAAHVSMMSKGLLVEHKQTGAHGAITATSVTSAGAVSGTTISGTSITGTAGLVAKTALINGTSPFSGQDYFLSGCIWSADAVGSTRLASMTSGVVVIGGKPLTVAAVTSRTFTASKDVYVDFKDNGDGTAVPVYYDNTTNAASPTFATTTGTVRNAIIVVGATNIATTASINQGRIIGVLPLATGTFKGIGAFDSNAYPVNPRSPIKRLVGSGAHQDTPTTGAPGGSAVAWNAMNYIPFICEANTNYRLTMEESILSGYSGSGRIIFDIYIGTTANDYTQGNIQEKTLFLNSVGHGFDTVMDFNSGTNSGLRYLSIKMDSTGWSGTASINGSSDRPGIYTIEKIS
jgi:hypothetical protein